MGVHECESDVAEFLGTRLIIISKTTTQEMPIQGFQDFRFWYCREVHEEYFGEIPASL